MDLCFHKSSQRVLVSSTNRKAFYFVQVTDYFNQSAVKKMCRPIFVGLYQRQITKQAFWKHLPEKSGSSQIELHRIYLSTTDTEILLETSQFSKDLLQINFQSTRLPGYWSIVHLLENMWLCCGFGNAVCMHVCVRVMQYLCV